jgi:hypothetical protein
LKTYIDVFVTGYNSFLGGGTVDLYDGNIWTNLGSYFCGGVWVSSRGEVFITASASGSGKVLSYNRTVKPPQCFTRYTDTRHSMIDIWGSSESDVFTVGGNWDIIHYDGTTWSSMTSGTTNALQHVWGSSGSDVFAVGWGGTILHYTDTSTTTTTIPDTDSDGILDDVDNCPTVCNSQQLDANGNGIGDLCDPEPGCGGCNQPQCEQACPAPPTTSITTTISDTDSDGILDNVDNCPTTCNPLQLDADSDGIGDLCDDPNNDGCGGCGQQLCEQACS